MLSKERVQEKFGQVLYELRMEKNITQQKLAERSHLEVTYISSLERGVRMPSIYTVYKLSMGLGIDLHKFMKHFSKQLE